MTNPALQETIEALEGLSDTPGGNYAYGELSESDKDLIDDAITLLKAQQAALTHLREAVWIAEQHTDSATGRRLQDYKKTTSHVVRAIDLLTPPQTEDRE